MTPEVFVLIAVVAFFVMRVRDLEIRIEVLERRAAEKAKGRANG